MMPSNSPDAVWINVSPSFQRLDRRLLQSLAGHTSVTHWAYGQTPDEPSSLQVAMTLLHDYIKGCDRPLHLLGHGTGGLLGLLYARQQGHRVKSLTLLSVGVNPMVDWQSHYYAQLEAMPCSRYQVLSQMVYTLFGHQARPLVHGWVRLLEQELCQSLSPHSLVKRVSLFPGSVPVPLLVCGSADDGVTDPGQIQGWRPWLKQGDRIWQCPDGRHFFHSVHPQVVANQILSFWATTAPGLRCPLSLEQAC